MSLALYDPFEFRTSRFFDYPLSKFDDFPSRFFGRHLSTVDDFFGYPRAFSNWWNYWPKWDSLLSDLDRGAQTKFGKDKFNVDLDVEKFRPDEVAVKVSEIDNSITVEGKHEERPDKNSFVSKQFQRRYVLPKDHDLGKVQSKLSPNGVLSITAPRVGDHTFGERRIPITHSGYLKPIDYKF